jgi:sialate O-acetylesterase
VLSALCLLAATPLVVADVELPAVIGDNMVLQRHQRVPIWGTADAGEKITVTFAGQQVSTTTRPDGRWIARLTALVAGGPYEMTIAGKNIITLRNVLVGEVWACSGQSNMAFSVQASNNAQEEIAAADYPMLRLLTVPRVPASEPVSDIEAEWVVCSPQTVPGFSAVGYFFGRELHKELGVPIGLINTSWGGTPAESWTTRPTLEEDPDFAPIVERWNQARENYPEQKKKHEEALAKWKEEVEKAKAEGKPPPRQPGPPLFERKQYEPGSLYNGMIAPLIPYAIRGAIWYQGESNAGRAYQYRELFAAMIRDWRREWGQGAFPFLFVQLANFMAREAEPAESAWAELREAQSMTLSLPKSGQAVIIDIGEADDIHPKNKQDVGRRLALNALAIAYGRDIVYSGPVYRSMEIEGDRIRLHFDHVGGGLMAKGGGSLKGFAIAGEDRKFVWADANIEGDLVVVHSDGVPNPAAVRYAWANNPECNLYNEEGLPASPFRTDSWPGVTEGKL